MTSAPLRFPQIQRLSLALQRANLKHWVSGSDGRSVDCRVDAIVLHQELWDLILAEPHENLSGNCDLEAMKLFGLPVYVEADSDAVWRKAIREFKDRYHRVLFSKEIDGELELVVANNYLFQIKKMEPCWKSGSDLQKDSFSAYIGWEQRRAPWPQVLYSCVWTVLRTVSG